MDCYEKFNEQLKNAAEAFRQIDKKDVIKLVSHLDADGISACSLMVKLLNNDSRRYSVSVVPQLNRNVLLQFASEPYNCFIFTDIGSGVISDIRELLKGKKVFILDHHSISSDDFGDVVFVNPHLCGIDGGKEVSGAGVVFKFACAVDKSMEEFAHIAIVGAIGDLQEKNGFLRLNSEILGIAVEKGKIKVQNHRVTIE